jgi:hypothetical protein
MNRHAKLLLTAAQLAALHHLAIDLAQERGLRRLSISRLIQEAVLEFLKGHGVQVVETEQPPVDAHAVGTP